MHKKQSKKKQKSHSGDSSTVNKGWLVQYMHDHYHCTKKTAEDCLDMVTETIMAALKEHKKINLIGFGSFTVQHRPPRDGRNPRTGALLKIAAYKQISFKAGSKLKHAVSPRKIKAKA